MYQIDQAVAALPPTAAVRIALQVHFFPSNLRIDKLPLPDTDRDMLAMRLEGHMSHLAKLAEIVDTMGPEGYLDPATGTRKDRDYMGVRLLVAVLQAQQLNSFLAINDAWRALDAKPMPKSAAVDGPAERETGGVAAPVLAATPLSEGAQCCQGSLGIVGDHQCGLAACGTCGRTWAKNYATGRWWAVAAAAASV